MLVDDLQTIILGTETARQFQVAVARAVELLRAGEVVALPTETVYGLAANALDARAVGRLFEIKGRPSRNPIIVHVAGVALARQCAEAWPEAAGQLAEAFWPGPLTLVLRRASIIPDIVTAGGETVGIRWPSHPFMQQVIQECGFPLAAPSANRSTEISPTSAEHVRKSLGGKIPLIVDGGQSRVGIESTVIDLSVAPPELLRPGMVHAESLLAVLGDLRMGRELQGDLPRSPGLLKKHYSPKARLVVWNWRDDRELALKLRELKAAPGKVHVVAHRAIPGIPGLEVSVVPEDPEAYARALYSEWHRCDQAGADWIVMEALPDEPEWRAIADRVARASAP
jgi:L-threonylcarbamoyladenylate synthase